MTSTKKRQLKSFANLSADAFTHPLDAKATDALKRVPGFEKVVSKVMEYGLERVYYLDNTASNVRVTPKMFGLLHKNLTIASAVLGVDEPELYVSLDPVPNAYTYGHTKPFIVLTSGLVDLMSDEELLFVIGHELGHIRCGHVLYTVVARNIASIVAAIGKATLGVGALLGQGLVYALLEWSRKAEYSADRAGLLCVQDFDVALQCFMKLAGGSKRLIEQMDQGEFMEQIQTYDDADRSNLNRAYKLLMVMGRTHPYAISRAKEMDLWHSGDYQDLLSA